MQKQKNEFIKPVESIESGLKTYDLCTENSKSLFSVRVILWINLFCSNVY